ncbi:aspartate/glutamate racemase family protein [Virgibacillus alimentarius]|uniref:Allantoin racemase n=1 Tax=Virgibacillus alimentarius TaxID=698769 RepID=A0ABS4SCA9_9BACI|nr:aspartate/glutamate racemase family protein [Virgibacillus alimentarius]MBP2259146.1 allantoin racemase [Virgibacillus alimentarius]
MKKILFINPIHTDIFNNSFKEMLNTYKEENTKANIVSLNSNTGPCHLQFHSYEALVMPEIVRRVKQAENEGYDATVIGCFYDTALRASREISEKMVITAPAEASLHIATTLGESVSIIVSEDKCIPEMKENVKKYGFGEKVASFKSVNLKVHEFQKKPEETKNRIESASLSAINNDGADIIVLGCTAEFGMYDKLQEKLGVPVIDSGLAAFKYAESLVELKQKMNWSHSKLRGYKSPPREELKQFRF